MKQCCKWLGCERGNVSDVAKASLVESSQRSLIRRMTMSISRDLGKKVIRSRLLRCRVVLHVLVTDDSTSGPHRIRRAGRPVEWLHGRYR